MIFDFSLEGCLDFIPADEAMNSQCSVGIFRWGRRKGKHKMADFYKKFPSEVRVTGKKMEYDRVNRVVYDACKKLNTGSFEVPNQKTITVDKLEELISKK